jgi:putative transcriptional regulator
MSELFQDMMNGLNDVEEFLAGKKTGFRVHVPDQVNVKNIRESLKMTQAEFSRSFGFSIDAVKHWECGRRNPEAPSRAYLTVIDANPKAVIAALLGNAYATRRRAKVRAKSPTKHAAKRTPKPRRRSATVTA